MDIIVHRRGSKSPIANNVFVPSFSLISETFVIYQSGRVINPFNTVPDPLLHQKRHCFIVLATLYFHSPSYNELYLVYTLIGTNYFNLRRKLIYRLRLMVLDKIIQFLEIKDISRNRP